MIFLPLKFFATKNRLEARKNKVLKEFFAPKSQGIPVRQTGIGALMHRCTQNGQEANVNKGCAVIRCTQSELWIGRLIVRTPKSRRNYQQL